MRPDDFILNTDYQSIANVSNKTYTITFAGQSVPATNHTVSQVDIAVDQAEMAMAQYLISKDGLNYFVGSDQDLDINSLRLKFEVHRISAKQMRATLIAQNVTESAQSYPTLTFTVKEALFNAPDMV